MGLEVGNGDGWGEGGRLGAAIGFADMVGDPVPVGDLTGAAVVRGTRVWQKLQDLGHSLRIVVSPTPSSTPQYVACLIAALFFVSQVHF